MYTYTHTSSCEVHCSHTTEHRMVTWSKPHQLYSVVSVLHQVGDNVLCCTWFSHAPLPLPPLGHPAHHRVPGDVVGEGEVVEAGSSVGVAPWYCDTGTTYHRISENEWCSSVCPIRTKRITQCIYTHCIWFSLLRHNSPYCIYAKVTCPCLRLHGSEELLWHNLDTNTKWISFINITPEQ